MEGPEPNKRLWLQMRDEVFQGHFVIWLDNTHAQLPSLTLKRIKEQKSKQTKTDGSLMMV